MKAERVTIHFGLAKTGTTFLQGYLANHRSELLKMHGILYPSFDTNHYHIQTILSKEPQSLIQVRREGHTRAEDIKNLINDVRDKFSRELSETTPDEILISSEYFTSMPDDELFSLKDFFLKYARNIRAIVYMRDPCSQAVSAAQQNIRDGLIGAPVKLWYRTGQVNMIRKLDHLFGPDLIVRPFFRGIKDNTEIVDDFFKTLKIPKFKPRHGLGISGNFSMGRIRASILAELNNLWSQFDTNNRMIYSPVRDILVGSITSSKFKDYAIRLSRLRAEQVFRAAKNDLNYIHQRFFDTKPIFFDYYAGQKFKDFNCDISLDNVEKSKVVRLLISALPALSNRFIGLIRKRGK